MKELKEPAATDGRLVGRGVETLCCVVPRYSFFFCLFFSFLFFFCLVCCVLWFCLGARAAAALPLPMPMVVPPVFILICVCLLHPRACFFCSCFFLFFLWHVFVVHQSVICTCVISRLCSEVYCCFLESSILTIAA